LAYNDLLYVYDASTPSDPDAKMQAIRLRPVGAKITNHARLSGNIAIPALAALAEGDATIAVPGAQVGDHLVFNLVAAPPASVAVVDAWVSADGTVALRFRNAHASVAYGGGTVACAALASRSIAP
jgi:hypothetical protein